ncbi:serine/threonine-protein phosphatase 7 long form homolog [Cryptomeria japonica]|uniref:serine/threonine-protein phosphatase 7 long form homolog n=1 Tax=Cryptomeria japonica TaxID=3369 RepID=UPI0027DA56BE|nr:serine/threonine-protein phosphatase 7 long form homolog [Cryptomeria japonica]
MIIALIERLHSKTCYFHLSIGEASITLQDLWCILHIPIFGTQVTFDHHDGVSTLCTLFECLEEDLHIRGRYEIHWDDFDYDDLTVVLACTVARLFIPDRHTHDFSIGWGQVMHDMIIDKQVFAWGPCLLATLYHQMHGIAYLRQESIGCGITLIQMWAYEHITIFYPTLDVDLEPEKPYAYRVIDMHLPGHVHLDNSGRYRVESGEEDVDISGETVSMRSFDRSDSEGDELASGSSSNDGDEGGGTGHDVDMAQDIDSRGVERGDEEGLRD